MFINDVHVCLKWTNVGCKYMTLKSRKKLALARVQYIIKTKDRNRFYNIYIPNYANKQATSLSYSSYFVLANLKIQSGKCHVA